MIVFVSIVQTFRTKHVTVIVVVFSSSRMGVASIHLTTGPCQLSSIIKVLCNDDNENENENESIVEKP